MDDLLQVGECNAYARIQTFVLLAQRGTMPCLEFRYGSSDVRTRHCARRRNSTHMHEIIEESHYIMSETVYDPTTCHLGCQLDHLRDPETHWPKLSSQQDFLSLMPHTCATNFARKPRARHSGPRSGSAHSSSRHQSNNDAGPQSCLCQFVAKALNLDKVVVSAFVRATCHMCSGFCAPVRM
jgi:hypothetical protein